MSFPHACAAIFEILHISTSLCLVQSELAWCQQTPWSSPLSSPSPSSWWWWRPQTGGAPPPRAAASWWGHWPSCPPAASQRRTAWRGVDCRLGLGVRQDNYVSLKNFWWRSKTLFQSNYLSILRKANLISKGEDDWVCPACTGGAPEGLQLHPGDSLRGHHWEGGQMRLNNIVFSTSYIRRNVARSSKVHVRLRKKS